MSVESPYRVLGVPPEADEEAIVDAYRERVLEAHPDQGGSHEEFRRVRQAYRELVDQRAADTSSNERVRRRRSNDTARVEYLNYEVVRDRDWNLEAGIFDRASDADLSHEDYGRIAVERGETLLEAAENRGFQWPYSCRGGACANCAVFVIEGDLSIPTSQILPQHLVEEGFRLSCVGKPITNDMKVVYNVHLIPELEELRLPPKN